MNIYLIENTISYYDSYDSHVIIANNNDEVRMFAKKYAAGEGEKNWEKANIKKIGHYTGEKKKPFVLLSSFNAG